MPGETFEITTMDGDDLETALAWAEAEGWNPGLHDAETYYTADPKGFFIGCLGDEPVATISAVRYSSSFGFLGMYIVKPEYRGRGYGIRIWSTAMDYLSGCNIALDGVVEQQGNYRNSGFESAGRNIRYAGEGDGRGFSSPLVSDLSRIPFDSLSRYLRPFFPEDRSEFYRAWFNQADASSLGIIDDGELCACGVIRACREGHKIGPLFANSPMHAETLFRALRARVSQAVPLFLDVPAANPEAEAMAQRFAMRVSFETARMYTDRAPDLPWSRTFGLTSLEIG
ncbi:MAG: GNAT family N-acetyltransferase [Pseudomonadota bacterium]